MSAGPTQRRGSGREIPALIALAVWAGGFEVAPFLHAIEHGELGAHEHGAAAHCHDGACHEHGDEEAPDPEHGEGSLAHRGLAAHTAPPALPPIDPPPIATVNYVRAVEVAAPARLLERPRARAPPG